MFGKWEKEKNRQCSRKIKGVGKYELLNWKRQKHTAVSNQSRHAVNEKKSGQIYTDIYFLLTLKPRGDM